MRRILTLLLTLLFVSAIYQSAEHSHRYGTDSAGQTSCTTCHLASSPSVHPVIVEFFHPLSEVLWFEPFDYVPTLRSTDILIFASSRSPPPFPC